MMSIGLTEALLIVCFVLLVFGAKRIPEVARALGKASREFKKARDEIDLDGGETTSDIAKNAGQEQPTAAAQQAAPAKTDGADQPKDEQAETPAAK